MTDRPDDSTDALLHELRARNRILLDQTETLRAELALREDEIVRLTRRLRQAEGL